MTMRSKSECLINTVQKRWLNILRIKMTFYS